MISVVPRRSARLAENRRMSRLSRQPGRTGTEPPNDFKGVPAVPVVPAWDTFTCAHACSSIIILPGQVGQKGQTAENRGFALSRSPSATGTGRDRAPAVSA